MFLAILQGLKSADNASKRYAFGKALFDSLPAEKFDAMLRDAVTPESFAAVFEDWTVLLDDWNRFDLSVPWYWDAFHRGPSPNQGLNPYLAIELACRIWEVEGTTAAIDACTKLTALLGETSFSMQGDDFHKGMVEKALSGLRRVIAYEAEGGDPAAVADGLHDQVRARIWPRLWQLAHLERKPGIRRMALLYPHIFRGDAAQTLDAITYFYAPYGFWRECIEALDGAVVDDSTDAGILARILAWRVRANLQTGDIAAADEARRRLEAVQGQASEANVAATVANARLSAMWATYRHAASRGLGEDVARLLPGARAMLQEMQRLPDDTAGEGRTSALLLLGHLHEDTGEIDAAGTCYLAASKYAPSGYLLSEYWRAASFLAGAGHWDAAANIQQKGVETLWPAYGNLAGESYRTAEDRQAGLPKRALMLNCDGIGDDLWRVMMALRCVGFDADYSFVVDDRLKSALERGLPGKRILTRSRGGGSHPVSIERYHRDRLGIHRSLDRGRMTTEIVEASASYGGICLSEDVFAQYFRSGGNFDFTFERPILVPAPQLREQARQWLATLPKDKFNIGLSWRTGVYDLINSLNHFRVEELGKLFGVTGINWVVLQYLADPAELALAETSFGVKLHAMPGVDLKDDIEQVVAIVRELRQVVSTPSTIEALAGTAGTPVLSLGPGYYSVNQYRIAADGETDRIIPGIKRLTIKRYGSKAAILEEAARRLRQLPGSGS